MSFNEYKHSSQWAKESEERQQMTLGELVGIVLFSGLFPFFIALAAILEA